MCQKQRSLGSKETGCKNDGRHDVEGKVGSDNGNQRRQRSREAERVDTRLSIHVKDDATGVGGGGERGMVGKQ